MRLHHVQLACPPGGEDEARRFWVGALGFEEVDKPAHLTVRGGAWFRRGECEIHVRVDDLAGTRAALDGAGFPTRDEDPLPGYDRFYVDDPFGNRLEVLSRS